MTSSTPTAQSLEAQIGAVLAQRFGVAADSIASDVTFTTLELDSLALVELSDILQELFAVAVGDDDLNAEQTVGEVADLMLSKLNEPARVAKKSA